MEKFIRTVDGKDYIVGYASMMAPSNPREKGKVFKMFQVYTDKNNIAADIHFFEYKFEKWIWIRDYSYINLNGDERLLDCYDNIPKSEPIEFDTFERLIFNTLYL